MMSCGQSSGSSNCSQASIAACCFYRLAHHHGHYWGETRLHSVRAWRVSLLRRSHPKSSSYFLERARCHLENLKIVRFCHSSSVAGSMKEHYSGSWARSSLNLWTSADLCFVGWIKLHGRCPGTSSISLWVGCLWIGPYLGSGCSQETTDTPQGSRL